MVLHHYLLSFFWPEGSSNGEPQSADISAVGSVGQLNPHLRLSGVLPPPPPWATQNRPLRRFFPVFQQGFFTPNGGTTICTHPRELPQKRVLRSPKPENRSIGKYILVRSTSGFGRLIERVKEYYIRNLDFAIPIPNACNPGIFPHSAKFGKDSEKLPSFRQSSQKLALLCPKDRVTSN